MDTLEIYTFLVGAITAAAIVLYFSDDPPKMKGPGLEAAFYKRSLRALSDELLDLSIENARLHRRIKELEGRTPAKATPTRVLTGVVGECSTLRGSLRYAEPSAAQLKGAYRVRGGKDAL
jgi:hypothetical protein